MKIYSPEGDVGSSPVTRAHGVDVLTGKRVAVLDNGKPNARLLLTTIADELASRTGAVTATVVTKENAATPADPSTIESLADQADVALAGSAD